MSRIKWDEKTIIEFFEKEGYKIIENKSLKYSDYIDFICPNGHKHKIIVSNFVSGQRCGLCVSNRKWSFETVKELFESSGYKMF